MMLICLPFLPSLWLSTFVNIRLNIKKHVGSINLKHIHIDKTFQMRLCLVTLTFDLGFNILFSYCLKVQFTDLYIPSDFEVTIFKDGLSLKIKNVLFICTSQPQSTYEIIPLWKLFDHFDWAHKKGHMKESLFLLII